MLPRTEHRKNALYFGNGWLEARGEIIREVVEHGGAFVNSSRNLGRIRWPFAQPGLRKEPILSRELFEVRR